MPEEPLYSDRAALYDRIYHWKDYAKEAASIRDRLDAGGVPRGGRLLEAAVGTANHLVHLAADYAVAGFDLHEGMLAHARSKLPHAHLFRADMTDFAVDAPYDALICLFSSIGYVHGPQALAATARGFAAAVRPGGLVIVEPWLTPEQYVPGRPSVQTYDSPDLCLARVTSARRDGDLSVLDMHYLVSRRNADTVEHFAVVHRLWMVSREDLAGAFTAVGFDVRIEPDGLMRDRGLLVGRKA